MKETTKKDQDLQKISMIIIDYLCQKKKKKLFHLLIKQINKNILLIKISNIYLVYMDTKISIENNFQLLKIVIILENKRYLKKCIPVLCNVFFNAFNRELYKIGNVKK